MLNHAALSNFKSSFRGELIESGNPKYDSARAVYNGMIDRRPRLIARCTDSADVAAAVTFGRDSGLPIAVRGGGHNAAGLGVCDDGLVIDLSPIRYTHVEPATALVRVGGGTTWGDVDHATHAFGLAVPTGFISTTGVGGFTLGGGIGYLTRQYGLTIDNLLAADMVLADGSHVTASAKQHPDLFWAIRGGGGNFGVVTSFQFQGQPIHTDYAGPMLWEIDKAPEVMAWYREFIATAPDDINGFFAFLVVPPGPPFPESLHNKKMCGIVWCYTGPMSDAERRFKLIRSFLPSALDLVGPIPHPALQSMFDPLYPPGLQWYWKADFVNQLSNDAIKLHLQFAPQLPSLQSTMHMYPVNGAASRVDKDATAWSFRDTTWAMVIVGVDPKPENKPAIIKWAREYWQALHPYSAGGGYVNFMMDEGEDRVKATYRGHYDRLAEVKAKYDPDNLFRVNQNIPPSRKKPGVAA
jgi:FAD/FMN-containing dehydrogenase